MNETNNNVTTYIIQMIPQQTELCVMTLSVWQYETAAVHSEDTQNPEVHDMIMHACRVIGKWQGHSACMAYTFFFFFEKSHSEFELPHSQCQYTVISYSNYIIESFVVILQIKEDCEQLFLVNSSKDCASD